jgi:RNA recognition motif-containing protein
MKRIFVGNLAFQSTEDGIRVLFTQHGDVSSVKIITDRETGRSRGFAFVEMADDVQAEAAIQAVNGADLDGRPLRISEARPREAGAPRGDRRPTPRQDGF